MKKLYDVVKGKVGKGICYLALLSALATGCKSALQKQTEETQQRTQLEEALIKYDEVVAKRMAGQIKNVQEIKDKYFDLEWNFYQLNLKRFERGMIPFGVPYTPYVSPYTPYVPPAPRTETPEPGFYPQERSETQPKPKEQPKDTVVTKNPTKGARNDQM